MLIEIKARNLEMCLWHKQSNKTMYGIPQLCQMHENILRASSSTQPTGKEPKLDNRNIPLFGHSLHSRDVNLFTVLRRTPHQNMTGLLLLTTF